MDWEPIECKWLGPTPKVSTLTRTLTLTLTRTLALTVTRALTLTITLILTLTKELNSRISFYLDLVSEGRTKGHEPQAYLREDGDIWQRYEALLRREGLLDFDSMLVVFRTMLESHEDVRARFLYLPHLPTSPYISLYLPISP